MKFKAHNIATGITSQHDSYVELCQSPNTCGELGQPIAERIRLLTGMGYHLDDKTTLLLECGDELGGVLGCRLAWARIARRNDAGKLGQAEPPHIAAWIFKPTNGADWQTMRRAGYELEREMGCSMADADAIPAPPCVLLAPRAGTALDTATLDRSANLLITLSAAVLHASPP